MEREEEQSFYMICMFVIILVMNVYTIMKLSQEIKDSYDDYSGYEADNESNCDSEL